MYDYQIDFPAAIKEVKAAIERLGFRDNEVALTPSDRRALLPTLNILKCLEWGYRQQQEAADDFYRT